MTAELEKLNSLADRAARLRDQATRMIAIRTEASDAGSVAVASEAGGVVDTQTPFYNHLMSMIDETAVENRRVQQDQEPNPAPLAANDKWRVGQVLTATAGLVVVVAVASAAIEGSVRWLRTPTVVATESTPEKRSLVVAGTAKPEEEPVARSVPAKEPDSAGAIDNKGKGTAESDIETGSIAAAMPEEPPVTKPAAMPSGEKLDTGSKPAEEDAKETAKGEAKETGKAETKEIGKEAGVDSPAEGPVATKAAHAGVIDPAQAPPSEKAAPETPPSPAPESKAEMIFTESAPLRIARIVSDVRMRAGPSNSQAVLATLSRGAAVEVVSCRAWCEVIYGAQRGWIYKGFIGASESSKRR